jgi:hypothetical protein
VCRWGYARRNVPPTTAYSAALVPLGAENPDGRVSLLRRGLRSRWLRIRPFHRRRPDLDSARAQRGEVMDEARIAFALEDRTREAASAAEAAQGLGKVQSFIELPELRRLLSRLATAELLRMLVAERFG